MPRVVVRCPLPFPEVTGVTIQVFSLATGAPWYVSNRQIHEDLGVPLLGDQFRALTESIDSKLMWENPSTATRQVLKLPEGRPCRLKRKTRAAGDSRPVEATALGGQVDKRIAFGANSREPFG